MDDLLTALLRRDADVFQDLGQRKRELAHDLIASSLFTDRHDRPEAEDGLWFEPALFMTRPTVLRRLVSVLGVVVPDDVDRLAGTEPGSLAIVAALSLEMGLPFIALREAEGGLDVRGELHPGERVVLVEDVTSTGARTLAAAETIRAAGGIVVEARCVIDSGRGARDLLRDNDIPFEPVFPLGDLLDQHAQGGAR